MTGKTPVKATRPRRRVAMMVALALTTAIAIAAAPAVASAESLWVSHAPTVAGNGKSCTKPGYNAIQEALNEASSGATVHVCSGAYEEQLKVTKAVRLTAAGSATVKLPATPANSTTTCGEALSATTQAVIDICGAGQVKITGVNVEGNWPAGTCNEDLYDIFAGNGTNLTLVNASVLGAGATPINGCQGGLGVLIGSHHGAQVATGKLTNDIIEGYQKEGVEVDGTGSRATISGTTVKGAGPTNLIAQNGIQVSRGAVGKILRSTITENEYEGSEAATGLIFYQAGNGSRITNSTIGSDDIGVDLEQSGTSHLLVSGSKFENSRYYSVLIEEGNASVNKSTMNGGENGIALYQFAGETHGPMGTANHDTIENMSSYAVIGFSDNEASDPPGSFRIINSKISNNPPGASVSESVFSESPTLVITAEKDS